MKLKKYRVYLAPLAGSTTFVLLGLIFGKDNTPKQEFSGPDSWPYWAIMFLASSLICYVATLVVGLPIISILKSKGKITFTKLLLVFIPVGALITSGCLYLIAPSESNLSLPLLVFAGYGAASAAAISTTYYWLRT